MMQVNYKLCDKKKVQCSSIFFPWWVPIKMPLLSSCWRVSRGQKTASRQGWGIMHAAKTNGRQQLCFNSIIAFNNLAAKSSGWHGFIGIVFCQDNVQSFFFFLSGVGEGLKTTSSFGLHIIILCYRSRWLNSSWQLWRSLWGLEALSIQETSKWE